MLTHTDTILIPLANSMHMLFLTKSVLKFLDDLRMVCEEYGAFANGCAQSACQAVTTLVKIYELRPVVFEQALNQTQH